MNGGCPEHSDRPLFGCPGCIAKRGPLGTAPLEKFEEGMRTLAEVELINVAEDDGLEMMEKDDLLAELRVVREVGHRLADDLVTARNLLGDLGERLA